MFMPMLLVIRQRRKLNPQRGGRTSYAKKFSEHF
jgi:hypothetical protein